MQKTSGQDWSLIGGDMDSSDEKTGGVLMGSEATQSEERNARQDLCVRYPQDVTSTATYMYTSTYTSRGAQPGF